MLHFAPWKKALIALVCVTGILMALPNVYSNSLRGSLEGYLPTSVLNLGLDLQGGSYLLMEIDQKSLVGGAENTVAGKTRRVGGIIQSVTGDVRAKLREAKIGYQNLKGTGRTVTVRIRKLEDIDRAFAALKKLAEPVNQGLFATGGAALSLDVSKDGAQITLYITDEAIQSRMKNAVQRSLEVIRKRIDPGGTTEPIIQRQGLNRILIQVPGAESSQQIEDRLAGTAKLSFQLLCNQQPQGDVTKFRPEPGCELLEGKTEKGIAPSIFSVHTSSSKRVDGEDLQDAQAAFDQTTNEPIVSFRLNTRGAKRFGALTRKNVGRPFAIVLDSKVISAPVIREPIVGGAGQISGNFSVSETNDLAINLRSGALPAKLVKVEGRSVGPSLGADSVAAGKVAAIIGLAGVVIFILVSYGLFGAFANFALLINIGLIIGILSFIGATLTLPGVAGIVLTIGMAVDANVLIFERIREEMRQGRSPMNAIDTGYARALSTILDANITTLLAAVILLGLGSGPIRGFAVTLGLGIVTSFFTAFVVTRLFVSLWVRRARPKALPL